MSLEDDIQQRAFKSQQQKLAVNLLYTCGWLNAHYAKFFRDTDLTPAQYNVLRILRGQQPEPCTLKVIKERMLDPVSDASRIVDKLVSKGLVQRRQCPGDRRSVNLLISEKGLKTLASLDHIDEEMKTVFHALSGTELKTLNNLLDKLRDGQA